MRCVVSDPFIAFFLLELVGYVEIETLYVNRKRRRMNLSILLYNTFLWIC